MTSVPIRDPLADHLITPQNAALIVVNYQRNQFRSVRSMDSDLLVENVVSTANLAKRFGLPIVHSTVGVAAGQDQSTLPKLADLLEDYPSIDRTAINSWEDADFLAAVRATGRRKLILCALWIEMSMAFTALDAMPERHEVYPVVDAIAGTSNKAHRAGLERVTQAGAQPISWISARRRATARLGAGRDRSRNYRDRLHRPPVDGMSRKSALMERSRTDHTRDPLCPVRSRPIKNNATAIQLSGRRLQP